MLTSRVILAVVAVAVPVSLSPLVTGAAAAATTRVPREGATAVGEPERAVPSIVDVASDGIAWIDGDETIRSWNAAFTEITGVVPDQAIGQPWFVPLRLRDDTGREVLPGDGSDLAEAMAGRLGRRALSFQVLRRDAHWRVLRATFAPVDGEDEDDRGVVIVARDVTTERELEELKADFIATVSHELRTPLTPLKGFLTTLQHRGADLEPERLRPILDAMAGQVSRLENLISDLLIVADLDRDAVALTGEPLHLPLMVRAAVEEERRGDRVTIQLDMGDRTHVVGDPAAVIRIVRALVSNAVKHTEGHVTVEVASRGGDGIVSVRDEGPGIPPWAQQRVFHRFHRLGDHLTRPQGSGLGLAIARALADRMGGSLDLLSEVDQGSTFTLRLPLARPQLVGDTAAASPRYA